jgi:hypothetical protein
MFGTVLIYGGCEAAWIWDDVRAALAAAGVGLPVVVVDRPPVRSTTCAT